MALYPALDRYLASLPAPTPSPGRDAVLRDLGAAMRARVDADGRCDVLFVCTHNSRRSQLAQALLAALAARAGLVGMRGHSAGTVATRVAPPALATLRAAGCRIDTTPDGGAHVLRCGPDEEPLRLWSKTLDDPMLPRAGFIAVMTCSDADEACPHVPGAIARFALPYPDPKTADDTPGEARAYDSTRDLIATELHLAIHHGWPQMATD